MKLRVLVVDDTVLFRTVVSEALKKIPGVDVIGTAASGRAALAKAAELKPDLITLDIEMPGMDGLQVLDELKKAGSDAGVIIVSSVTVQGGSYTIKALERGAFDFITKPSEGNAEQNRLAVYEALAPRVKAFARKREINTILSGKKPSKTVEETDAFPKIPHSRERVLETKVDSRIRSQKPEMLLIGVSTGGPAALAVLLSELPANLGIPVIIVQHMPPMFTNALADSLKAKCKLKVCEASNGDILQSDTVYIAPGGKQMKLGNPNNSGAKTLFVTDDSPENNCKPSVDYLFRSAASNYPGKSMAVILTGMGSDGTLGLRLLKRHGCYVIAQDEQSCVVYGMPRSAVDAGVVDCIVPLQEIAGKITNFIRKGLWCQH
ncbi:MAG: chemotaxis response regulator protein-glutamate methylesterase [Fibrobacter sp.]|nr:chemotaxis response regulator protein-glutamate methylesterase [Fibrobacter sp.]